MPLSCDPEARAYFVLESDRKLPKDQQPTFELRFCSVRQWRKAGVLYNQICAEEKDESLADDERLKVVMDYFTILVTGWRNFHKPFSIDNLIDSLTEVEMWELIHGVLTAIAMGEAERRGFTLPSPDSANGSAQPAATAAANA